MDERKEREKRIEKVRTGRQAFATVGCVRRLARRRDRLRARLRYEHTAKNGERERSAPTRGGGESQAFFR